MTVELKNQLNWGKPKIEVEQIIHLLPEQTSGIHTDLIERFTAAHVRHLTQEQIQALSPRQIALLFGDLFDNRRAALTPQQIAYFNGQQIAGLNDTQLLRFCDTQHVIPHLTQEQIQALSQTQINLLFDGQNNSRRVAALNPQVRRSIIR